MENTYQINIPATTANLGLGFDSMGMALGKYLEIEAKLADEWSFEYDQEDLAGLPNNNQNLLAQAAIYTAEQYEKEMPALAVRMASDVPLARGMGSSSSAIVAGIECANHFLNLDLTEFEKVLLGTEMEGHPDNIGPCVTGGVFVGFFSENILTYYTMELSEMAAIVSVPPYEVLTSKARAAMPDTYSKEDAVFQNAANNVMLLAMQAGDYETMGDLMMQDRYHEDYRAPLIKEFEQVRAVAVESGAYATVISGAGPTMLTLCSENKSQEVLAKLKEEVGISHEIIEILPLFEKEGVQ